MKSRTFVAGSIWLAIASGCAGDGCSCVGPIPGGFAPEDRVSGALQVRVSDTGLSELSENANALVTGILGETSFELPQSCTGNPTICCNGGTPTTPCGPIEIDLATYPGAEPRLQVAPQQGQSRATVTARARVRLANPVPFNHSFTGDCVISSYDTRDSGSQDLRVDTAITFTIDSTSNNTYVDIADIAIEQFDCGDLEIDGGFLCDAADTMCPILEGYLLGPIEDEVNEAVAAALCKSCPSGDVAECGPFADSCTDNVCMSGDSCIQELGFSGRLYGAALLGGFSPGIGGAVDIYEATGGFANTDGGGITLGGLAGAAPAGTERDRCGPSAAQPALDPIALSSTFAQNTHPDTGAPFDFAVGVHQSHLDHMAWSAYEGGFLCMNIGTDTVAMLNSDTLALLMPSLIDLLAGTNAQIVLGLRPQSPPTIALGPGTFTDTGAIDEPLFDVQFSGLEIDLLAMIDDQFVRVLTLRSDVRLALGLDVTENGELLPVLGDTEGAFTNLVVTNSEALLESPEQLANRFPAVLDFALPLLSSSLGSFALPELAGVRLAIPPGGITSVDDNAFLALFGDFEFAAPATATGPAADAIHTTAEILAFHVPDSSYFLASEFSPANRPHVDLALGGRRADGSEPALEWSVRVDGGLWSPFVNTPQVRIARRAFWLQGRHRIEVRARAVGQPGTTDRTPVVLEPVIDVMPPRVIVAEPVAGAAVLLGTDNVSKGRLQARYRVDGGPWRTTAVPARLDLADLADLTGRPGGELEVEMWDEAGNRALQTRPLGRAPLPGGAAAGCSAAPGGEGSPWPAVTLALALVWLLRRRTRAALAALAVIATGLAPGCDCSGAATECASDFCLEDYCSDEIVPGLIGRHASIAASGDRVVVAAYEDDFGDLLLYDVGDDGRLSKPVLVDGVPLDAPVAFEACTYRGGIIHEGANVGAHTSVALVGSDARIAYQDIDRGALAFATQTGDTFAIHTIDPGDTGRAGLYTSLALDPDDHPAIAYLAVAVPGTEDPGALSVELRFARATTPEPAGPGDWAISVIDQAAISCAGLCGDGGVCVQDGATQRCAQDTADCPADCGNDACVAGACLPVIADPPAYDLPAGTGLFADLGFLPDGTPIVVHYDRDAGALVLQRGGDDAWTRIELDARADADTGRWASMAIDAAGTVHVAYQEALTRSLLYTTWRDGETGAVETVDDGSRDEPRIHPVGASAALFIDPEGRPSVAYQDGLLGDLILARREGDSWRRDDLAAGPPLYGFFVTATSRESGSWIASLFYDRSSRVDGGLRVDLIR